MTVQINERGQILMNLPAAAQAAAGSTFSRYNGGWVKRVTGIDKSHTNGYSILGDFIPSGRELPRTARQEWISPGLYLDCSIAGSRKHQTKTYHLFAIKGDGTVELLARTSGPNWAIELWPHIEQYFATTPPPEAEREAKLKELLARREQLMKELALVEEQIKLLTE